MNRIHLTGEQINRRREYAEQLIAWGKTVAPCLSRHRGDAAHLSAMEAAVRRHVDRGGQATATPPGDGDGSLPPGAPHGLTPAAAGRLGDKPQAVAPALARGRAPAPHPGQEWRARAADGRRLTYPNVIDEHSRFCLAPAFIHSDNGPKFIAHALRHW